MIELDIETIPSVVASFVDVSMRYWFEFMILPFIVSFCTVVYGLTSLVDFLALRVLCLGDCFGVLLVYAVTH